MMQDSLPVRLEGDGVTWFLVSGAPRSGTTVFGRLLNSHARVGCLHEVSLAGLASDLSALFRHHRPHRSTFDTLLGCGATLPQRG